MVAHGEDYYVLDEETEPILIYKGDAVCHNVLTVFAEQFGAALERAGEHVIYYDLNDEDVEGILKFTGRHFKAVIGVQSYLFSVKMADEVHYVHEYIYGPKYNFIFDHPVWLQKHLQHHYPDFIFLHWIRIMLILREDISEKKRFCFRPQEWKQKLLRCRNANMGLRSWEQWEIIFTGAVDSWTGASEAFSGKPFSADYEAAAGSDVRAGICQGSGTSGTEADRSGIFEPS